MSLRSDGPALLGGERDSALHFAGRKPELAALREHLHYIMATGSARGGMALVDGSQGVGKTELLHEFARSVTSNPSASTAERKVGWLNVPTTDLDGNPEQLFKSILNAAAIDQGLRKVKTTRSLRTKWFGLTTTKRALEGNALNLMLLESAQKGLWANKGLLITVDEVQTVTGPRRETIRLLHEGAHECPIMLVCAGLQHAAGRLAERMTVDDIEVDGISRLQTHLTLRGLERAETVEVITQSVGRSGSQIAAEHAERLAEASMDYPQHIHCYVKGALTAIDRYGAFDTSRALELALELGDEARKRYYRARLENARVQPLIDLVRRLDAMGEAGPVPLEVAEEAVGGDGAAIIESAIRHGVLTRTFPDQVDFGIPSFRDFIRDLGSR